MGTKLPNMFNCSSCVALVVFLSLTFVVTLAYPTTLESVKVNVEVFPRGNEHAKDRGQFKGFRISVPSNDGIALASVRYNVNSLVKGSSEKFPLTKNGDGGWSYEDMSKILKKGDMLYWQLTYIMNGLARVQHDVFNIGSQHGGHNQRKRRQLTSESETDSTESTDSSDEGMSSDDESPDLNSRFGGGGYDGGSKRGYHHGCHGRRCGNSNRFDFDFGFGNINPRPLIPPFPQFPQIPQFPLLPQTSLDVLESIFENGGGHSARYHGHGHHHGNGPHMGYDQNAGIGQNAGFDQNAGYGQHNHNYHGHHHHHHHSDGNHHGRWPPRPDGHNCNHGGHNHEEASTLPPLTTLRPTTTTTRKPTTTTTTTTAYPDIDVRFGVGQSTDDVPSAQ